MRNVDTDLTPLLAATLNERLENVKLLMAAGADRNAGGRKDYDPLIEMTPLMGPVLGGSEDLVRLFLEKGADVSAKAPNGLTALLLAKESKTENHRRVARRLTAAGAKR